MQSWQVFNATQHHSKNFFGMLNKRKHKKKNWRPLFNWVYLFIEFLNFITQHTVKLVRFCCIKRCTSLGTKRFIRHTICSCDTTSRSLHWRSYKTLSKQLLYTQASAGRIREEERKNSIIQDVLCYTIYYSALSKLIENG